MDFSGGLNVGFVCDIVNRNWHWRKEDVGEKDCATVVCLPQCIRSGSERKLSHSFTHFSHWLGHSYSTHLNVKRHQDILKILFPLFAKYANWPYFSSRFYSMIHVPHSLFGELWKVLGIFYTGLICKYLHNCRGKWRNSDLIWLIMCHHRHTVVFTP